MPKPSRREGSGLATARADALARLVASILARDTMAEQQAMAELDVEFRAGTSPCGGIDLRNRVSPLLSKRFGQVHSAMALPKGGAGDVEVDLSSGSTERIEIKAQLDKLRVSQLTEADWVRNECDGLRWLMQNDAAFRRRLGALNQAALTCDPSDLQGWHFSDLWLSDVVGLTSSSLRLKYGLHQPSGLSAALDGKHLLHLCRQRDSLRRLIDIRSLRAASTGRARIDYELKSNKANECAVQVFVNGEGPVFTYHVYRYDYVSGQGFCGRHKLHGTIL